MVQTFMYQYFVYVGTYRYRAFFVKWKDEKEEAKFSWGTKRKEDSNKTWKNEEWGATMEISNNRDKTYTQNGRYDLFNIQNLGASKEREKNRKSFCVPILLWLQRLNFVSCSISEFCTSQAKKVYLKKVIKDLISFIRSQWHGTVILVADGPTFTNTKLMAQLLPRST